MDSTGFGLVSPPRLLMIFDANEGGDIFTSWRLLISIHPLTSPKKREKEKMNQNYKWIYLGTYRRLWHSSSCSLHSQRRRSSRCTPRWVLWWDAGWPRLDAWRSCRRTRCNPGSHDPSAFPGPTGEGDTHANVKKQKENEQIYYSSTDALWKFIDR